MGEWNYIILAPIAALLFAIGGTGYKWARRFVLPAVLLVMCWLNGLSWWQFIGVGVASMIAYCLPYGDSLGDKWWGWVLRSLVVTTYFAALLFAGFSWILIISPCILIAMFAISKMGLLTWKIWELTAGFLIGITLGGLL